ncbi:MAG: alkylation response protein AidB-like acyl-CoA dehydrogenase [Acidimicrobiales bacterium]|jgi:alkylation response protein AidB-like acyl-CoA dehydrogenase
MTELPTVDKVKDEARTWLEENWDPQRSLLDWRGMLVDSGWGTPSWPTDWHGRGLPVSMESVVAAEFAAIGAVGVASGVSMYLVAPTLLAHGSDDVKQRFLRPILTGEHKWCQLFSEPGSGSDLAGLTTRADRDGDEWVVTGQKVWNSGAHKAAFGILMARTNWDVPKHKGISYFAFPMDQPGVEIRPLKQMNGHASFNEVFFDEARVPHTNLVGAAGEGWRVATTTLMHERSAVATKRPRFVEDGGPLVEQARAEAAEYFSTYKWYPQRAGRSNLVRPEIDRLGKANDPLIRDQTARLEASRKVAGWTLQRARDARVAGKEPGPEGSLAKLNMSLVARMCNVTHTAIQGANGMLTGPETAAGGMVAEVLISTPAMSIAGGTDEIQHNIIGERVLGLPKEPDSSKDTAYREVKRN